MSQKFSSLVVYLRMAVLFLLKIMSHAFYRTRQRWISKDKDWHDVKLVVLLNHTSLFEFVYASVMPFSYLKEMSKHLVFPVADITYKRKFFGNFLKFLGVSVKSLTRKKDTSWFDFLRQIKKDSILIFLPEGRMKRKSGLDKSGRKMTVRGGIADVLPLFKGKKMLFAYSGGLHHVLAPGDRYPKILKNISISLETIKVNDYISKFLTEEGHIDRQALFKDLEMRRDRYCVPLLRSNLSS
jgi:hypothetical protein